MVRRRRQRYIRYAPRAHSRLSRQAIAFEHVQSRHRQRLPRRRRVNRAHPAAHRRKIGRVQACGRTPQAPRTAIIPHHLRNVPRRRTQICRIRGIPERAYAGPIDRFIKLRPAHRSHIRARRNPIHRCHVSEIVVVRARTRASRRARIAGSRKDAYALRSALLPHLIPKSTLRRPKVRLAVSKADTHNLRQVLVDDVGCRQFRWIAHKLRRSRHHVDHCSRRHCRSPFRVDCRLRAKPEEHIETRIEAILNHGGQIRGQPEEVLKCRHVRCGHIRFRHNRNRLAGAVHVRFIQRQKIVDRHKIAGGNRMRSAPRRGDQWRILHV